MNLSIWKRGIGQEWLKDAPSQALQQALKDREKASRNFFARRVGFPRIRRIGRSDSFRHPEPKQIQLDEDNRRTLLPKPGWLRYRTSREVPGQVRNATVSHAGGQWFVSIQTERDILPPLPAATSAIGIDVGIARFATMSDARHSAKESRRYRQRPKRLPTQDHNDDQPEPRARRH